jgi:hypothetical protein
MFSNLLSITLPNIGKYFPGIHFPKENYFPANKRALYKIFYYAQNNKKTSLPFLSRPIVLHLQMKNRNFIVPIHFGFF